MRAQHTSGSLCLICDDTHANRHTPAPSLSQASINPFHKWFNAPTHPATPSGAEAAKLITGTFVRPISLEFEKARRVYPETRVGRPG